MKVITGEAMSNIIKHAYGSRYDRPIFIESLAYQSYIELRFRDMGAKRPVGKNLSRDISDYRERGLGLYLIGKLSDYHIFDQSLEIGNQLIIKKRIC